MAWHLALSLNPIMLSADSKRTKELAGNDVRPLMLFYLYVLFLRAVRSSAASLRRAYLFHESPQSVVDFSK